jgi:hypothetical protein
MLRLGNAELALGRINEARDGFEQAQTVAHSTGTRHAAIAGLARAAMAQNDLDAALKEVRRLLAHVDAGGKLEDVEYLRLLELTCYQVLARAEEPRASEWLDRAYTNLQATAATLTDAKMREGFLANIPEHREIVKAWMETQAAK